MNNNQNVGGALVLGVFLCAGLIGLGYYLADGFLQAKALERTVTVKGLSEREVPADVAIWPIKFSAADNELTALYAVIEKNNTLVVDFLKQHGFSDAEITVSVPAIVDRQAQSYGNEGSAKFRYLSSSSINVYSQNVDRVRATMNDLVELGKQGLAIAGQDYESRTQFLFTQLNDLKPGMIEEATRNAREVAGKFAQDSVSTLGKIKTANQGQFSIEDRDSNTPHIKKVRVVSTVEYYLSD
ncbi:MAG: SIMPL domain-containing protein [Gammaproteobacteria bacterium]|nr:SIMPL domain-containing protein [Gammaproteobacteria bacterium]MBU2478934.1 SIMPL domain-containing protein [Gammaproteobacteria bacterium]